MSYMSRTVYISASTIGALNAYQKVISGISKLLGEPNVDVKRHFYSLMFQLGVDDFLIPSGFTKHLPNSEFLSSRIREVKLHHRIKEQLKLLRRQVQGSVLPGLPNSLALRAEGVEIFLADLFVAAELKMPVAITEEFFQLADYHDVLSPEMLHHVEILLASMKVVEVDVPLVRIEIPGSDFGRFTEVLKSDLFRSHVSHHALLDNSRNSTGGAITAISESAFGLFNAVPHGFDLRKSAVTLVTSVPDMISAIAGSFWGEVSKLFVHALEGVIAQDRRLVIYSFNPVWRQIWGAKLNSIHEALEIAYREDSNNKLLHHDESDATSHRSRR